MLTNTATVSSSTTDPNTANDTDTETTTVQARADLSITKDDTPDPVTAGGALSYTITVNNAGPSDAQAVTVNDTLPGQLTGVWSVHRRAAAPPSRATWEPSPRAQCHHHGDWHRQPEHSGRNRAHEHGHRLFDDYRPEHGQRQ